MKFVNRYVKEINHIALTDTCLVADEVWWSIRQIKEKVDVAIKVYNMIWEVEEDEIYAIHK